MNRQTVRRRLVNLLFFIIGIPVLLALWLRWNEPRMIYYPLRELDGTPADIGLAYETVSLTTADGVGLHAWWVPGPEQPAAPAVLFCHGNAGNISHRLDKLRLLHELGASTLIFDYRGYGQSDGRPDEAGTYADADAAYAFLRDTRHRAPDQVLCYGESLGAAIAVDLATRVTVGGVIIEEAFTSVAAIGQRMFPFLPIRLLVKNKYDTLSKIEQVQAPLLVFHSSDDEIIPFRHGNQLFAAASSPKTFVTLRGGHNDAFLVSYDEYREGLETFLASRQPPAR